MKRTSLYVATVLAGAIGPLGAYTTPATAAGGPPAGNCPLKNGPGSVLMQNVAVDLMANDMIFSTKVLQEGAVAEIVCVKGAYGMAQPSYEGDAIDYFSFGAIGIDKVVVGTVDENGIYNSVEVTYDITAVQLPAPTVLRKAKVRHGKVVKPAIVGFINDTDLTLQVMAGDSSQMNPDVTDNVAPGKVFKMPTMRKKLDFLQLVIVGTGKGSYPVANSAGQANTVTGKVQMDNLWFTPEEVGMVGRKMVTRSFAAERWIEGRS